MTIKTPNDKLNKLIEARECDTEWLQKYKSIIDGLHTIAEMCSESCNENITEWSTIENGLSTLSRLLKEDIEGRSEEA